MKEEELKKLSELENKRLKLALKFEKIALWKKILGVCTAVIPLLIAAFFLFRPYISDRIYPDKKAKLREELNKELILFDVAKTKTTHQIKKLGQDLNDINYALSILHVLDNSNYTGYKEKYQQFRVNLEKERDKKKIEKSILNINPEILDEVPDLKDGIDKTRIARNELITIEENLRELEQLLKAFVQDVNEIVQTELKPINTELNLFTKLLYACRNPEFMAERDSETERGKPLKKLKSNAKKLGLSAYILFDSSHSIYEKMEDIDKFIWDKQPPSFTNLLDGLAISPDFVDFKERILKKRTRQIKIPTIYGSTFQDKPKKYSRSEINSFPKYRVTSNGLSVREGRGMDYKILFILKPKEIVSVVQIESDKYWWEIVRQDGNTGFVAKEKLEKVDEETN